MGAAADNSAESGGPEPIKSGLTSPGAFMWQVVQDRAMSQRTSVDRLAGRSKDLLGTATIATTITGAFANDNLFDQGKLEVPMPFVVIGLLAILVLVAGASFCIWPRGWTFSFNPIVVETAIKSHEHLTDDDLQRAMAEGMRPKLEQDFEVIQRMSKVLAAQVLALGVLTVLSFWIVFQVPAS